MPRLGGRNSALSLLVAAVVAIAGWWMSSHHSGGDEQHGSSGSCSLASAHEPSSVNPSGDAGSQGTDPKSGLPYVWLSSLPTQAGDTVRLIDAGGPFPCADHDGGTFGNYEGVLPQEDPGYYKEYTVLTPGSDDRGARRIIAGADGTLYWTADHYEHFAVIKR